jgi:hypothetical protein
MNTHSKIHTWVRLWLLVLIPAAALVPVRLGEAVEVEQVLEALRTAYALYQEFQREEITLEQATADIINAVNAAKTEILAHIDAIAAAQAKACARAVVISYANIGEFTEDVTQQFANDSIACLSEIESVMADLDDPAAVDTLGFALNALGPVALLLQAHAGFDDTVADILDLVESGNQVVIGMIVPYCWRQALKGDATPPEILIRCTLKYKGDDGIGSAVSWVGDPNLEAKAQAAERYAYRNTSRRIAESMDLPL